MPGNLITEEAAALIGRETEPERNRFPISAVYLNPRACDVADSIEDYNPLYVDPDYADKSRFGGLLCPPLAAWKDIAPPIGYFGAGQEWHFEVPLPFNSYGLNGGSDWQFLAPVYAGSWITRRFRIMDIFENQGRSGPLVFIVRPTYWVYGQNGQTGQTGQNGTTLSQARRVSIHRALPAPPPPPAAGETSYLAGEAGGQKQPSQAAAVSDSLTTVPVAPQDPEVILPKPVPAANSQRYYEDVAAGMELPPVVKGPMTTTHLIRWAAANGNYARIHWDLPFAQLHQGLPNVVVNGSLKNQYLGQLLLDFAGEEGWFKRFYVEHRGMDFPGNTLTAFGRVTGKREVNGFGCVECEVGLRNDRGHQTASGTGTVVLPRRGQSLPMTWEADPWVC